MTETRRAGWFVAATVAATAGATAADAVLFHGWTRLFVEAMVLAIALPTGFGSVRWWFAAVDATQTGRHRKPRPPRAIWRLANTGDHAYAFTERHGEHVWDETHSDTGWFPLDDDTDDTDVLDVEQLRREEAYR